MPGSARRVRTAYISTCFPDVWKQLVHFYAGQRCLYGKSLFAFVFQTNITFPPFSTVKQAKHLPHTGEIKAKRNHSPETTYQKRISYTEIFRARATPYTLP